jgi:peptidoglycan/xylan/chitin deacetylase (PgdA/CDA1 family)
MSCFVHLLSAMRHGLRGLLVAFLAVALQGNARTPESLDPVYLYASPLTGAFFGANGSDYDTLKVRWRLYLKRFGKSYREVSRADLLRGLKPGVLILGSAVVLDQPERQAVHEFAAKGGSLVMTWGTGARDGTGKWSGYGFIENLMQIKVTGKVQAADDDRFVNTFGDSPLTWGAPAGTRFFLGQVPETPLRVAGAQLAGRYFNWSRFPTEKSGNGAIAYVEKDGSRRVFLGFSEISWEFDDKLELPKALDSMISWLRREPRVFKAAWPNGELSAQLLEMDTEDRFQNAVHFARDLDNVGIAGTFYSLTSAAKGHPELVRQLSEKHEIAYHAEVHVGFRGKSREEQESRLLTMVEDMKGIVGSRALKRISGFRAPTESWDATTEQLLRKYGVRHHVADPSSSDARVPFFSRSEPEVAADDAIVVLPRTQMDDLNFLALKLNTDAASALIARDFDYLHEAGALGVLSVHSQNYGEGGLMTVLTLPYLKRLQQHRHDVWSATGQDIAAWWRSRERVRVKEVGRGVADKGFQIDVRSPGASKGVTLMVIHPSATQPLKAVLSKKSGDPKPQIQRVDEQRSAVIFTEELRPGLYEYTLDF